MSVTSSSRILRAEHTSYDGTEWRVDIHDSLAVSTNTRETVLSAEGVKIKMEGRTQLYDWIHPTTAEFSIAIQTDDHETTVAAFAASGEQRYYVFIYKDGTQVFTGAIINDTVYEEDAPYPYFYTINAIDGLSTLKDKEYSNNGAMYTGRDTFAKVIQRALSVMPTAGFYDDSIPPTTGFFLNTAVNWYESQMPSTAKDPLEWTQIDYRILDKREISADEPEFYTCWEVLELCCLRWGARLFYWDNAYWFIQPHLFASGSTFTAFSYIRNAGTSATSSTKGGAVTVFDSTNTTPNSYPKAGGQFTYYRPVKRVKLKYYHSTYNYLQGQKWTNTSNPSVTVDDIDTSSGNVKMVIGGRFWLRVYDNTIPLGEIFGDNFNGAAPVQFILDFNISVGTYYLYRQAEGTFGNLTYRPKVEGQWIANSSYRCEVASKEYTVNGEFQEIRFGFTTDSLPNIGTQTWTVDQVSVRAVYDGQVVAWDALQYITWQLNDPYGYLFDDENPFKSKYFTWHIATNSNSNQRDVTYEIPFADEPNDWSVDRLTVWNGSGWVYSENWQVNKTGTQYSINDLLVRTMASLQKLPIKVRNGGYIKGDIKPFSRLNYQGNDFIAVQYALMTNPDEYNGEFMAIAEDASGITVTNETTEINRPLVSMSDISERGAPGISFYNGIPGGELNEYVDSGAKTTIPIVAASYAWLKSGDIIRLLDPYNGVSETLTVSANVAAGATSISVTGTLSNSYPVGTQIFLDAEWSASKQLRESNIEFGNWDNVTAAFIDLTTPTSGDAITPPDSDTLTTTEINKRITVWRNGVKQRYRGDYSGAFTDYGYKLDDDNSRIYFYPSLEAEDIEVQNVII